MLFHEIVPQNGLEIHNFIESDVFKRVKIIM